ncbi:MAG: hypothetical protein EHM15_05495 [Desulfobacteraceae bacterium]|nr:MAG: hypothetical protein EHM15_05495 [Desulfobacteraceae bacterium]
MHRTLTSSIFPELTLLLALSILFSGCAASHRSLSTGETEISSKIAALQDSLTGLKPHPDPDEARRVAETAVTHSLRLADAYRVVPPARWHNVLIQVGIRERGLCFHWTEDLMQRLQALGLSSFDLHWGVAHRGSDLREHNSVVITAAGQPFEAGLVLDPWRNSGDLFWTRVDRDAYPWAPLPRDEW